MRHRHAVLVLLGCGPRTCGTCCHQRNDTSGLRAECYCGLFGRAPLVWGPYGARRCAACLAAEVKP